MPIKIVQKGDPVLRKIAKEVAIIDIKKKKIQDTIANMKKALIEQDDGVAIAAPQIGEAVRIFVISGKVFDEAWTKSGVIPKNFHTDIPDIVFINPEFIKLSKDRKLMPEGCLSVRWLYGKIRRSSRAEVKAINEDGVEFKMKGTGLLAEIFQHEMDHLNGILFVDNAIDIYEGSEGDIAYERKS